MENPLTQSVLQPILPSLSPFIHDSSEVVRLSMCKMLNKVKNMKFIKYYEIVNIENILHRMVLDSDKPKILLLLSQLICNSFFPDNVNGSELVSRSFTLIEKNYEAANLFFSQLHKMVNISRICKLIKLFDCFLISHINSSSTTSSSTSKNNKNNKSKKNSKNSNNKKKSNKNKIEEENDEEEEDDDEVSVELLENILWNIYTLWDSIHTQLELKENSELLQYLNEEFTVYIFYIIINK